MSRRGDRAIIAARAAELKRQGLIGKRIAEQLGIATSYAYELLDDPTGEKVRLRKRRYDTECVDCGKRIDGTSPSKAGGRCVRCANEHKKSMTRAWIADSIQEWVEQFGSPPRVIDWSPSHAQAQLRKAQSDSARKTAQLALDRHADLGRPWPSHATISDHYGSWGAFLSAFGHEPLTRSETPAGRWATELRRATTAETTTGEQVAA